MGQSLANVLIFILSSFTEKPQSQNLVEARLATFRLANKWNMAWGSGLNSSPWHSSSEDTADIGTGGLVGGAPKIASKWKHHSPFMGEEMFLNQLGSPICILETVPIPLRSASSPCSATKNTPPFALQSTRQSACFCSGSQRENLSKIP